MARFIDAGESPAWKWNKKSSNVNLGNLNSNISGYLSTLPQSLQAKILATSGNDSGHAKTSRHYNDSAVDLRFDDDVWNHIVKDPVRLKYGLTLLDPNHGSGKHIHLSHGEGSENKKDIWVDPYSLKGKELAGGTSTTLGNNNLSAENNITFTSTGDSSNAEALLNSIRQQMQEDLELDALQKQAIAVEQEKQRKLKARVDERNQIIDAINSNDLAFVGRSARPNADFAEGGEVGSYDDLNKFYADLIKADTPTYESPEYLTLLSENEMLQERINKNKTLFDETLTKIKPQTYTIDNVLSFNEVQAGSNEPSTFQGDDNRMVVYKELKSLGLTNEQVAGAIGSLSGESYANLKTTADDKQGAYGIAQWMGSRRDGLMAFAKSKGLSHSDINAQAKYLVHELQTTHKGVLNNLRKANSVDKATDVWTRQFEIPAEWAIRQSMGRRINFAKQFLGEIS